MRQNFVDESHLEVQRNSEPEIPIFGGPHGLVENTNHLNTSSAERYRRARELNFPHIDIRSDHALAMLLRSVKDLENFPSLINKRDRTMAYPNLGMTLKVTQGLSEPARQPDVVGVKQGDILRRRVADRSIACRRQALVLLPYISEFLPQSLHKWSSNFGGIVRAAVINQQDAPIFKRLRLDAGKRSSQVFACIVCRNDNVDLWHLYAVPE